MKVFIDSISISNVNTVFFHKNLTHRSVIEKETLVV